MLGGAGGIGQPMSLLLKQNTNVTKLAVFDIDHAKGERQLKVVHVYVWIYFHLNNIIFAFSHTSTIRNRP